MPKGGGRKIESGETQNQRRRKNGCGVVESLGDAESSGPKLRNSGKPRSAFPRREKLMPGPQKSIIQRGPGERTRVFLANQCSLLQALQQKPSGSWTTGLCSAKKTDLFHARNHIVCVAKPFLLEVRWPVVLGVLQTLASFHGKFLSAKYGSSCFCCIQSRFAKASWASSSSGPWAPLPLPLLAAEEALQGCVYRQLKDTGEELGHDVAQHHVDPDAWPWRVRSVPTRWSGAGLKTKRGMAKNRPGKLSSA